MVAAFQVHWLLMVAVHVAMMLLVLV